MQKALRRAARRTIEGIGGRHWLNRYNEWRASRTDDPPPATDADGVPIPSPYLMHLIGGTSNWRFFLENGEASLRAFADAAHRHGGGFKKAERILDFGCGCGRLARHLPKLTDAAIFGVDYNPRLVKWCEANLRGTFQRNRLTPPLPFKDDYFDVLYALSVFTHLRRDTQERWLRELSRVLKPGAIALVTFHDEDHARLDAGGLTRDSLIEKEFHVHYDASEGSNFISTFQSREFTRRQFGAVFDVLEIIPSPENPVRQAIAVLKARD